MNEWAFEYILLNTFTLDLWKYDDLHTAKLWVSDVKHAAWAIKYSDYSLPQSSIQNQSFLNMTEKQRLTSFVVSAEVLWTREKQFLWGIKSQSQSPEFTNEVGKSISS